MGYIKRAIKRTPGAAGIAASPYIDCECGHRLSIPVVAGMPMTHVCLCGREYDSRGYILKNTEICLCGASMQNGVCSVKGCVCSK